VVGTGPRTSGGVGSQRTQRLASDFFKKRVKKLNLKKGYRFENFRKMGASRPINEREAWGRRPPAHPTGGRSENFSQAPPEGLFANKKLFLFAKRPLRHSTLPSGGRRPARPTGGKFPFSYFLFEFLFYILFKIYTFFKYKIYSPYSFVYI
jgi:hypothetical protein